jgi:26S proteasome regulatory subunit N9
MLNLLLTVSLRLIDDNERLAFLTALSNKVNKPESQDAYVYALADVANVKLRVPDLEGAQKDLAACQKVLDSFDSVETVVHASFYKVNADYYHVRTPAINIKNRTYRRRCAESEKSRRN